MNKTTDDQARYVEDDVQDDAVIASAFRVSLIVILLLGLPVIGVLVYLNFDKKQEVSTEVEVTTPDIREVNEEEIPVVAGDHVTILPLQKHTVRSNKDTTLMIVEVQTGTYFGEDDIVRLNDRYGRV